ncbi:uncharacterized protein LOC125303418 [Alosa alosa]|uniref:uncharacterized protein LOC125303418 n=1 Tax=Alosa alosa TaxID=278164 RepID=UPI0020150DE4|nr:uncharacterized protein LOC125303418 [Alosa alosa]
MHGLPCSSLQYCFGGPADVSADPTQDVNPETCHGEFDPAEFPRPISAQPASKEPASELRDSSPVSCHVSHVSIRSKAPNGTKPSSAEPELELELEEDVHSLQSSPSLRELSDDEAQEGSPDLGMKYPQIPRPSIIRHPQECPPQEGQTEDRDYGVIEDGPLSSDQNLPPLLSTDPHLFPSDPTLRMTSSCDPSVPQVTPLQSQSGNRKCIPGTPNGPPEMSRPNHLTPSHGFLQLTP